ncbi:MAG: ATPase [Thermicanus sp.]|nr:ATPase [Thermicanus sp.]
MPHFIGIQGNLGAGKSTVASTMAYYYKNVSESRFGVEIELFSNYYLKGSKPMESYENWYEVANAQGSIVVWDEAQMVFDSRTSLKGGQITATKILNYCRKLKSIQFFVSPSIDNLDTRIRGMIEVLLNVRKMGNKGIAIDYFDYQAKNYGPWGKLINKRFIPASKVRQIHRLNLFDTFQIVQGFPMPMTERDEAKFFKTLEEVHNNARKRIFGKGVNDEESDVSFDRTESQSLQAAL